LFDGRQIRFPNKEDRGVAAYSVAGAASGDSSDVTGLRGVHGAFRGATDIPSLPGGTDRAEIISGAREA
jgi:hypothetical protein